MGLGQLTRLRANAFMNSWNSKTVRSLFDSQTLGFLTSFNGKTELHPTRIANAFRSLVLKEKADQQSPATLAKAREQSHNFVNPAFPYETISWGCFSMMLSELGKRKELGDILDYADSHLNPTWENGGLYYPRNDELLDAEGNMVHMEPHSGNSGIGYARLNVEDGQKKMWEQPWTRALLAARPWVDGIFFGDDVDFLRGVWDERASAMIITLKTWTRQSRRVTFSVKNLPKGRSWAVYISDELTRVTTTGDAQDLEITAVVGEGEVDIVVAPSTDAVSARL